jgi:hypothetical protein
MKQLLLKSKERWNPTPVHPPFVDPNLPRMNDLQRAAESFRYCLLRWEFWVSPRGDMREWLRHNSRVAVWLLIPAILAMPAVGLILWQVTGWLSMLQSIAGRLIVLPILALLALLVIRAAAAFISKR